MIYIPNCRAIGEGDLIKLGKSWRKLKRLQFEVDANYRYMKVYDRLAVDQWKQQWIPCDGMLELKLVNSIISPGRGLACVLGKCRNLEKIHLDMCVGVKDSDIINMARNSSNLRFPGGYTTRRGIWLLFWKCFHYYKPKRHWHLLRN